MSEKCVLAFSGGLDTSYCVKYLQQEKGLEVHSVIVNTGGFDEAELADIKKRANDLGVMSHTVIDKTSEYYEKGIRYLIYGNVLKNGNYPLSVSAERVFQAMAIAEYANKSGAKYIAHGSTGAGNDQVRFDMIFPIIAPQTEIITPIRDLGLSRAEEVEYLKKNGVDQSWEKAKYSINKGLWGTSIGGAETLTSHESLPESAWPNPLKSKEPAKIEIQFSEGQLVALNGQKSEPIHLIKKIDELCAPYAIGRDVHVGDTIIGIKGRVGFVAAAPSVIIKAHQLLEKHCLGKWQLQLKQQLADWYGMLFHEGQYLDPVMRDIEAFLESSQQNVSGTVSVNLSPYRFELLGVKSDYDLMQADFANYGEDNKAWSAEEAKGFIKILGNSMKLHYSVQQKVQSND